MLSVVNGQPQLQSDFPRLVSAVEELASTEPSRIAIEFLKELDSLSPVIDTITYGQLNSRANTLANYLVQMGITGTDLIALFLEKSIDSYAAVLAIAKIGAGLVPLSPLSSSEDISTTLSKLNVGVCILHSSFQCPDGLSIPVPVRQILLPDSFDDTHDDTPFTVDDGFRLIYTDPTSTQPVLFASQNLKSCVNALSESYTVQSESKLLFASAAASAGKFQICVALHIGFYSILIHA
jgi:acyl-CoA synthetase (AMP-forming)/AMP-acid ligase II